MEKARLQGAACVDAEAEAHRLHSFALTPAQSRLDTADFPEFAQVERPAPLVSREFALDRKVNCETDDSLGFNFGGLPDSDGCGNSSWTRQLSAGSTSCPSDRFSRCSSPGADEDGFEAKQQSPRLSDSEDEASTQGWSDSDASADTLGSRDACKEAVEEVLAPLLPIPEQRRVGLRPPLVLQKKGVRLAVVINGSIGDVLPLIALSLQLQMFHHTVRLFVPSNLVPICLSHGLEAVSVFADTQAVIARIGGMVKDVTQSLNESRVASEAWLEEHEGACTDLTSSMDDFNPQAIVAPSVNAAFRYENERGVPVLPVYLGRMALDMLKTYSQMQPVRPSFYACSPLIETKGANAIPGLHHTSEWVLYQEPSASALAEGGPLAELRRFLGTGPAPVAIGWGSMIPRGMKRLEMLGLALRALRLAGRRGVILGGWAQLEKLTAGSTWFEDLGEDGKELAAFAAKNVCFVNEAPHEWLFPQCCSVVHHGGAGTLQTALRAGKPAVVTPIFADQFLYAAALRRVGAGVDVEKSLQELCAEELAQAISSAEAKTPAAMALGQKMRQQVGERKAATIIDDFLRTKVMTGRWGKPQRAAHRWSLKSTRK